MIMVKFKSATEGKHLVKKLKKMQATIDELVECMEEKLEREDEYEDYEEDYEEPKYRGGSYRGRYAYRRGM